MKFLERITVALRRSESDNLLLRYARLISDSSDGRTQFFFVHVLGSPEITSASSAIPMSHSRAKAEVCQSVERYFRDTAGSCHILNGIRVDRLLEFAAESQSDAVLMGHRHHNDSRRSLSRRLAMKAPCSIWMVPDGSHAAINGVLAAIDFSGPSAYALSIATSIARQRGLSECLALHVYFSQVDTMGKEFDHAAILREKEQMFRQFIAPLDLHGVQIKPRFEEHPNVSDAVDRIAREELADLVVMGTRGRSRSAAILLGSESEQTLRETTRPLLVVKQRGERIGLLQVLLDRDFVNHETPKFG